MAVNPGSVELGEMHTALWISNAKLMELFDAFENHNIFLAAVKPRLLNVGNPNSNSNYLDSDSDSATVVTLIDGVIQKWSHINKIDLQREEFAKQWQQSISKLDEQTVELNNVADYVTHSNSSSNQEYSFFPNLGLSWVGA